MNIATLKKSIQDKLQIDSECSRILVIGLGITGLSVARFLSKLGFYFAVVDSRTTPPLLDEFTHEMPNAALFTGGFDQEAFKVATHMVISPGVSLKNAAINAAIKNGVKAISDIDLFMCAYNKPAEIVAITGSNGKSTVTSMLGHMINATGKKAAVGANLGTPALDLIADDVDIYVLELSSFQLERTHLLNATVATILNITPDHLDFHGSMQNYIAAKQNIFNGDGVMVLNLDDDYVNTMQHQDRATVTFSCQTTADFYLSNKQNRSYLTHCQETLLATEQLPLEGKHNLQNALAALALAFALKLDMPTICHALIDFRGLQHRMQKVAEFNGVSWINDSKATNIGACIAALQGYSQKVILIAGGDAKGARMDELVKVIKEKTSAVILMGKDANLIAHQLQEKVPVYFTDSIEQSVDTAAEIASPGDVVLLSPACASIDQYKNYQERGQRYMDAVRGLKK